MGNTAKINSGFFKALLSVVFCISCSQQQPVVIDDRDLLLEQFLSAIKKIESSDGKYINHAIIQKGPYKGYAAIGSYGLLPTTVRELVDTYYKSFLVIRHCSDEDFAYLVVANPAIEYLLAKKLAIKILEKNNYNLIRSAYAWNVGHNKDLSKISEEKILNNVNAKKMKEILTPSIFSVF